MHKASRVSHWVWGRAAPAECDVDNLPYTSRVTFSYCSSLFLTNCGIYSNFCAFSLSGNGLEEKDVDGSKDNRALVDNNTAQSLTSEDIDEMRK